MSRPLVLAALLAAAPVGAIAAEARVDVCLVPADYCRGRVLDSIDAARWGIRVQAYGFSDPEVIEALVRARGVDVAVVLDRSNLRRGANGADRVASAGIPVWIDTAPGIAHAKVIVIDGGRVLAGSYNFTRSAQSRNVEDLMVIDSPAVAARFLAGWRSRQALAVPLAQAERDGS